MTYYVDFEDYSPWSYGPQVCIVQKNNLIDKKHEHETCGSCGQTDSKNEEI